MRRIFFGFVSVVLIAAGIFLLGNSGRAQSATGWLAIPNSNLRSVCPPNGFGGSGYNFRDNCGSVTTAWSGGVFDTTRNRLIVWGGGHNDYYGNEIYAVNLNSNSIQR